MKNVLLICILGTKDLSMDRSPKHESSFYLDPQLVMIYHLAASISLSQ